MSDELKAQDLISIFVCKKDPDIENFLKEKAIIFEKLGKSRTYLIFDEDSDDELRILAYFTLALQVLKIPEDLLSRRKTKVFDGFSAKIGGEKITEFPAILIGQFGKNELFLGSLTGNEMMQYCLYTLMEGQARLGGRIVMLECQDIPYLIDFYSQFGFFKIEKDYEEGELLQMIKILQEGEVIRFSGV
ncbi:hypothetical protein BKP37_08890 [Anaerobacillus alkalilacustris]|uniref:GNAT family acetyltransferase n=1 Tax=Anaerobacillus alkalilacustris TaxID=393763 RepID=A0A1S2LP72_9BACI|nr:hypothetical protein [Anaerobacillus alkalilacustris]OIJ14281.1 hypothetical protein BKP37_08890 [Anaerobacillus alkalilacustris]